MMIDLEAIRQFVRELFPFGMWHDAFSSYERMVERNAEKLAELLSKRSHGASPDIEAIRQRMTDREHCHNYTGHEKHIQAVYLCGKCSDVDRMEEDINELLAEIDRLRKDNAGVLADPEDCMEGL